MWSIILFKAFIMSVWHHSRRALTKVTKGVPGDFQILSNTKSIQYGVIDVCREEVFALRAAPLGEQGD